MKKRIIKLSPNEEMQLLKEKIERKKRFRLLQVRQQGKETATMLSSKLKEKKEKCLQDVILQLEEEFNDKKSCEQAVLLDQLNQQVKKMGEGHRFDGKENYGIQRGLSDSDKKIIRKRYQDAVNQVLTDRTNRENIAQQQIELKKKVKEMEKIRTDFILSLPVKPIDPIENLQPTQRVIKKSQDPVKSFSNTHLHLQLYNQDEWPDVVIEKAESDEIPNAISAAKDEEVRNAMTKNKLMKEEKERLEKAELRHRYARQELLLQNQQNILLQNLENLELQDRQRRKQLVSNIPTKIYQSEAQMIEDGKKKQHDLEQVFEKIYNTRNDDPMDKYYANAEELADSKLEITTLSDEGSSVVIHESEIIDKEVHSEDKSAIKQDHMASQNIKLAQLKEHILQQRDNFRSFSRPVSGASSDALSGKISLQSMNIESACESGEPRPPPSLLPSKDAESKNYDQQPLHLEVVKNLSPSISQLNNKGDGESLSSHQYDEVNEARHQLAVVLPQIDNTSSLLITPSSLSVSDPFSSHSNYSGISIQTECEAPCGMTSEQVLPKGDLMTRLDSQEKTKYENETQTVLKECIGIQTSFILSDDSVVSMSDKSKSDASIDVSLNEQSSSVQTESNEQTELEKRCTSNVSDFDRLRYHKEMLKKQRLRLEQKREKWRQRNCKVQTQSDHSLLVTSEISNTNKQYQQSTAIECDQIKSGIELRKDTNNKTKNILRSNNSKINRNIQSALSELENLSATHQSNREYRFLQRNLHFNSSNTMQGKHFQNICSKSKPDPAILGLSTNTQQTNTQIPILENDTNVSPKQYLTISSDFRKQREIDSSNSPGQNDSYILRPFEKELEPDSFSVYDRTQANDAEDNVVYEDGSRFFRIAEQPQVSPIKEVDEDAVESEISLEEQSLSSGNTMTSDFRSMRQPIHSVAIGESIDQQVHNISESCCPTLFSTSNVENNRIITPVFKPLSHEPSSDRSQYFDDNHSQYQDLSVSTSPDIERKPSDSEAQEESSGNGFQPLKNLQTSNSELPNQHSINKNKNTVSFQDKAMNSNHSSYDIDDTSIQSLSSSSVTSFEELLQRVRDLPFRHQQQQQNLIESFKKEQEKFSNSIHFYENLQVSKSPVKSQSLSSFQIDNVLQNDDVSTDNNSNSEPKSFTIPQLPIAASSIAKSTRKVSFEDSSSKDSRISMQRTFHNSSSSHYQISTPLEIGHSFNRKDKFISSLSSVENVSLKSAQPIIFHKNINQNKHSSNVENDSRRSSSTDLTHYIMSYFEDFQPEHTLYKRSDESSMGKNSQLSLVHDSFLPLPDTKSRETVEKLKPQNLSLADTGKIHPQSEGFAAVTTSIHTSTLSTTSGKKTSDNISSLITDSKTEGEDKFEKTDLTLNKNAIEEFETSQNTQTMDTDHLMEQDVSNAVSKTSFLEDNEKPSSELSSKNIVSGIEDTKLALELIDAVSSSDSIATPSATGLSEYSINSSDSSQLFTTGRLSLQGKQRKERNQTELSLLSDLDLSSMSSSDVNWTTLLPVSTSSDESNILPNSNKESLQEAFLRKKQMFIENSKVRASKIEENAKKSTKNSKPPATKEVKAYQKQKSVRINTVPEILSKEKSKEKLQDSKLRTRNLYMRLPEVQKKIAEKQRIEQRKINREKAQLFHQKLQRHIKQKSLSTT